MPKLSRQNQHLKKVTARSVVMRKKKAAERLASLRSEVARSHALVAEQARAITDLENRLHHELVMRESVDEENRQLRLQIAHDEAENAHLQQKMASKDGQIAFWKIQTQAQQRLAQTNRPPIRLPRRTVPIASSWFCKKAKAIFADAIGYCMELCDLNPLLGFNGSDFASSMLGLSVDTLLKFRREEHSIETVINGKSYRLLPSCRRGNAISKREQWKRAAHDADPYIVHLIEEYIDHCYRSCTPVVLEEILDNLLGRPEAFETAPKSVSSLRNILLGMD
ncbi:hypothetical protein QR680_009281 [Steinernema hermaphroditum]|uniref:Uncharacterized protein n=1 Tax=Steinernema hermaphroditum TaxID=289476 RepID=A0AA39M9M4_9BILA|nr:hypothetical protein QR680_009281 [Steinernema hermaphroditum]